MKSTIGFMLASILFIAGQAHAEQERHRPRDPGVNQRQHYQQQRIHQGVKSGQLTGEEARGLRQQEKSLRQEERGFKSDGQLSKGDRKDLHQDLNNLSKEIYQEKHDGEVRR